MTNTAEITYAMAPRDYTDFPRCLKEIEHYFCPIAAHEKLKITRIESIFSESDSNLATGFRISASRAEEPDGQIVSEHLSEPLKDTLLRVLSDARQKLVNSQKTLDKRKEMIDELARLGETTTINGESIPLPKPEAADPEQQRPEPSREQRIKRLHTLDLQGSRVSFGGRLIQFDSQVCEEMREVSLGVDWSSMPDEGSLTLEQTRMLLDVLERAVVAGRKVLDEPFHNFGRTPDNDKS